MVSSGDRAKVLAFSLLTATWLLRCKLLKEIGSNCCECVEGKVFLFFLFDRGLAHQQPQLLSPPTFTIIWKYFQLRISDRDDDVLQRGEAPVGEAFEILHRARTRCLLHPLSRLHRLGLVRHRALLVDRNCVLALFGQHHHQQINGWVKGTSRWRQWVGIIACSVNN